METSVVTNGSLINEDWIQDVSPYLDILAISIDSSRDETNFQLGCCSQGKVLDLEKVKSMVYTIKSRLIGHFAGCNMY